MEQLLPAAKGTLFVDDFQISCASTNMSTLERQLPIAIRKITAWTNNNGFVISNQKTICMHFCRKRGLHPDPEIILNGVVLPGHSCFLNLGPPTCLRLLVRFFPMERFRMLRWTPNPRIVLKLSAVGTYHIARDHRNDVGIST
ncbi:hypothetical protein JTE90_007436 [Oedothorax gibbosus]|uniref:Reverse transcriptase domain-containing protein n=1 Tax=Oedothorax gibbosus TaxID=931172 RepID=A0AAV6UR45_9ARAC|nr:hypothetical protein JTE90_007436 [Oedothorax gibbosus]